MQSHRPSKLGMHAFSEQPAHTEGKAPTTCPSARGMLVVWLWTGPYSSMFCIQEEAIQRLDSVFVNGFPWWTACHVHTSMNGLWVIDSTKLGWATYLCYAKNAFSFAWNACERLKRTQKVDFLGSLPCLQHVQITVYNPIWKSGKFCVEMKRSNGREVAAGSKYQMNSRSTVKIPYAIR